MNDEESDTLQILIFEYVKNIYIKELEKSDLSPKIKSHLIDRLIDL